MPGQDIVSRRCQQPGVTVEPLDTGNGYRVVFSKELSQRGDIIAETVARACRYSDVGFVQTLCPYDEDGCLEVQLII